MKNRYYLDKRKPQREQAEGKKEMIMLMTMMQGSELLQEGKEQQLKEKEERQKWKQYALLQIER